MDLAPLIDHTNLKAHATQSDITSLCHEAIQFGFATVCGNPFWVPPCRQLLQGTPVNVCTVVGFPLGAIDGELKAREAEHAVAAGAGEIDMVINLGAVKSGMLQVVSDEITMVRNVIPEAVVKVIIEAAALTAGELSDVVEIAVAAGANFVKTSTGMHPAGGARIADVTAIAHRLDALGVRCPDAATHPAPGNPLVGIKASGGITTAAFAQELLQAGAIRLGTSHGVAICG